MQTATERVEEATRTARLARIAVAPTLRIRARRRLRLLRAVCLGLALVIVVALGGTGVLALQQYRHSQTVAATQEALAAARTSLNIMLSADPDQPDAYVREVLSISTGPQSERITEVQESLAAAVAEQPAPSVGRVSAAGIVGDGDIDSDRAEVLAIAVASNPELVGADPDSDHLAVLLTLWRVDGEWLVAEAEPL